MSCVAVHGMLRQASWAGPHPPLLPDYLDDAVSADVGLLGPQKIIMVQGLELNGPDDGEVIGGYDYPPAAPPAARPARSGRSDLTSAPRTG
jgi:hypothetical protein